MGLFDEKEDIYDDALRKLKVEHDRIGTEVPDPFDVAAVKQQFNHHLETINTMLDTANEYRITDQASMENAVSMLGQAVTLGKKLEVNRKSIVAKPNKYVKFVNSFVKKFYDTNPKTKAGLINQIEGVFKTKIAQFTDKQELERREKEKKAQEEAAALQAAIDKEAKKKGIETVKMAPVAVAEVDKVIRSDSGASVSIAKPWKAKVVNLLAVPRKYCNPDMELINEAVKAGLREIPGVEIWEDTQVRLRT